MKLLFDHNLSHKLVSRLADHFPDYTHTKLLELGTAADAVIWTYAKINGLVIVTLDKDFADLAAWRGSPPKIIWLRCGNATVREVENLLRANFEQIKKFEEGDQASLLEIWP
jgi:predicted nuclease of predicted toxin-antitoxin system